MLLIQCNLKIFINITRWEVCDNGWLRQRLATILPATSTAIWSSITHLYISHAHEDHLDEYFLKQYIPKDITVILADFRSKELAVKIQNCGFWNIIYVPHGGSVLLLEGDQGLQGGKGSLKVNVYMDNSCNEDSGMLITIPLDSNSSDSPSTFTFLHLNDDNMKFSEMPQNIDILACQYSGAQWYPQNYDYDTSTNQMKEKIIQVNRNFLSTLQKKIQATKCKSMSAFTENSRSVTSSDNHSRISSISVRYAEENGILSSKYRAIILLGTLFTVIYSDNFNYVKSYLLSHQIFEIDRSNVQVKSKILNTVSPSHKVFDIINAPFLYTEAGMNFNSWKYFPKELLAPFTQEVQDHIYTKQHPMSCENKKFLISNGNDSLAGLGSQIHVSGIHLGIALETDRIFLWSLDAGKLYIDDETCSTNMNFECFFRSPSNCTLEDAYKENSDTVIVQGGSATDNFKLKSSFVPSKFIRYWNGNAALSEHELKYWWRGQSTAYLMRFRPESINILKDLRLQPEKLFMYPEDTTLFRTFPVPAGTINLHVRHGDKGIEMELVSDKIYFEAAENLVIHNIFSYHRVALVTTEDPNTINYIKSNENDKLMKRGWRYLWYDVPRINSNGIDQLDKISTIKKGILTHIWWLQLLMALECDAWIGTRASNWNRLIDELRCIWVPKCKNVYIEVGNPKDYKDYGW